MSSKLLLLNSVLPVQSIVMGKSVKFILFFIVLIMRLATFEFLSMYQVFSAAKRMIHWESCDDYWILKDLEGLKEDLRTHLFGQPLVEEDLIYALRAHFAKDTDQPLLLSFHGNAGVGKTYVVQFIVSRMLRRGMLSKYYRSYVGSEHFPLLADTEIYKRELEDTIRSVTRKCEMSLFVFDEVHRIHGDVLDKIYSIVRASKLKSENYIDLGRSIFIFLSNTGGKVITDLCTTYKEKGIQRSDFRLVDFENYLIVEANSEGGLKSSGMIANDCIDHFIPFLPLERQHLAACVQAIMKKDNITGIDNEQNFIEAVIDAAATFEPESKNYFARKGCKRIEQKVKFLALQWTSKQLEVINRDDL